MTATCPSCGREQAQGLLCHEDTAAVETMLAAVPELVRQLDVAISKQAKVGGAGGMRRRTADREDDGNDAGLAHTRSPINFGALAVRDALLVAAAFVGEDIDWVRKHPQAAEMVRDLGQAVKDAYRAIDRAQDRVYLGVCMYEEGDVTCHAEVWARPGRKEVTCSQCGVVHEVSERQAWLLQHASDMLFTVKDASLLVGQVGHIRVTEASIRGYILRKRLAYRPGGKLIRLGDLLAVVVNEGERRSA